MKALPGRFGFFILTIFGFICVQAGPTKAEQPAAFRLTVELKDGSRVIGTSQEKHLKFSSDSLGEMRLPLEKVRFIESLTKGNQAKLITASEDSLVVTYGMKEIRVETAFGEVKLPVSLIKSMRVSVVGKGRPMDGLIGLWSGDGNADDSASGNNGINRSISYTDGVAG